MFLSGISDEAGKSLDVQIKAHRELGWSHIELRMVDGRQFTSLSDAEFDVAYGQLEKAGLKVSCFSSAIANWARPITGSFEMDLDDLRRSIPRMRRLGCPFIRIMSWPNKGLELEAWKNEVLRRMKELVRMAEDGGIVLALENCDGWASQSAVHMVDFLRRIDSPALKVVFDTGNPPAHGHNAAAWYLAVKRYIAYVHIKDCYIDSDEQVRYTWPGEGHGFVRFILDDLLQGGYDGGISIEPHVAAQIHSGNMAEANEDSAFRSYVTYGRKLADLFKKLRVSGTP